MVRACGPASPLRPRQAQFAEAMGKEFWVVVFKMLHHHLEAAHGIT